MSAEQQKDPDRVAAGLKAAMHNPHVSQAAKEQAAVHLRELEASTGKDFTQQQAKAPSGAAGARVPPETMGTHAIHGRHTRSAGEPEYQTEEIHTRAQVEREGKKDEGHIIAGYKAVLHNPHTSDTAKANARQFLDSRGVPYDG